jgi:hypothetical protein
MRLICETESLNIFESAEFVGGVWTAARRLYAGFWRENRNAPVLPVLTAVVTFYPPPPQGAGLFLEWLETTKLLDGEEAQDHRDEFMEALREHLPALSDPEPEAVEAEDGTLSYVDSADGWAGHAVGDDG